MFIDRHEKVTTIDIINVLEKSLNIFCTVAGCDYEKLGIMDGSRLEVERCQEPVSGKIFLCSVDDSVRVIIFTKTLKRHLENISLPIDEYYKLKNENRIIILGIVKRIFNISHKQKLRHVEK